MNYKILYSYLSESEIKYYEDINLDGRLKQPTVY
jgi:hypothetical protein